MDYGLWTMDYALRTNQYSVNSSPPPSRSFMSCFYVFQVNGLANAMEQNHTSKQRLLSLLEKGPYFSGCFLNFDHQKS